MQVPGATDLASKSHSSSDFNPLRPKDEIDDSYQLNGKVRCLCGGTIMTESVLQVLLAFVGFPYTVFGML